MSSRRACRHRCHVVLSILVVWACSPAAERAPVAEPSAARPVSAKPGKQGTATLTSTRAALASVDRSTVGPAEIPSLVRAACDSAQTIMGEALALTARREEGSYFDTSRGTPRVGCRLTASGTFKALANQAGPVAALDSSFVRHRWRGDLRYSADGPDGSTVGMRRREILCMVAGRWNGGDDEDTSAASTDADEAYEAIIECARDIASNKDAGVPDSIWSIAAGSGVDSVYAISLSLQYPPYLEGDFDGDGVGDAAVLIEQRASGKIGFAIVHRGTRRISILGAGAAAPGPDDLAWIEAMDMYPRGATLHLTIRDRPNAKLLADALWIGRRDSFGAFYVWTGRGFDYEEHRR